MVRIRLTEGWRNTSVCFHKEGPTTTSLGLETSFQYDTRTILTGRPPSSWELWNSPGQRHNQCDLSAPLTQNSASIICSCVLFTLYSIFTVIDSCFLCVIISYSWIIASSNYPDFVIIPEPPGHPSACSLFVFSMLPLCFPISKRSDLNIPLRLGSSVFGAGCHQIWKANSII